MKITLTPIHYIVIAGAVVVIAAGGFVGGVKLQQIRSGRLAGQFLINGQGGMMGSGQRGFGGRVGGLAQNQGFRPVAGEIVSQDDKSITVKLIDGSSKIVLLSDTTEINKASESSKADLKTGEKVMVFGTTNPDGSVTAKIVQLNPMMNSFWNSAAK